MFVSLPFTSPLSRLVDSLENGKNAYDRFAWTDCYKLHRSAHGAIFFVLHTNLVWHWEINSCTCNIQIRVGAITLIKEKFM